MSQHARMGEPLRLSPDRVRSLKDEAWRRFENISHADLRVGREAFRREIEAINGLSAEQEARNG